MPNSVRRTQSCTGACSIVGDPERGSYARYASVFRHFAARAPLQVLVTKAGEPGFVEWLHAFEGPGQT